MEPQKVVLHGSFNDETNLTERTYYIRRVYTNGSGQRWSEAHFYNGSGQQREVQNWARLQELARLVDEMGAMG